MRYATVNGLRQEPSPKLRGTCPNCEREVLAKCGQQRIWHWSHVGKLECDHWWEPETEWHRSWKSLFPAEWQEVSHIADNGERHIADVKTAAGLVIELQHSPITQEERQSREIFYQSMAWVVDGMRYKRDLEAFRDTVTYGTIVQDNPMCLRPTPRGAGILKRWAPQRCAVYLDFGDQPFVVAGRIVPEPVLWRLLLDNNGQLLIGAVTRRGFVDHFTTGATLPHLTIERSMPTRSRYQLPSGRSYQRRGRW